KPQRTAMTQRVIGIRKSNARLADALGAGNTTWGLVMRRLPAGSAAGYPACQPAATHVLSHSIRGAVASLLDDGATHGDTPARVWPGGFIVLPPGVEWSRLATRPGDPIPGRRTLLSSGDRWDTIRVDLVHVTGPSDFPETSVPDHRLVAHLDGPAQTRFW